MSDTKRKHDEGESKADICDMIAGAIAPAGTAQLAQAIEDRNARWEAENPALAEGSYAWARLQSLARDHNPSIAPAELAMIMEVGHFLTRYAIGHASPGDQERLLRMRDALLEDDEPRRVRSVQFVSGALKGEWPTRALLRDALGRFVDASFFALDPDETETLVATPGRKRAVAIAATLSIQCNAFGDRGSALDAVTARYRAALTNLGNPKF